MLEVVIAPGLIAAIVMVEVVVDWHPNSSSPVTETLTVFVPVITWLTGFSQKQIDKHIKDRSSFESFFAAATLHANAPLITGVICGYRIEEIEDPLTKKVRYLDKLVDELAKGKKIDKILRGA